MYSKILSGIASFLLTFIAVGIAYILITHQDSPTRYISLSSIEGNARATIDSVELHGEIFYHGSDDTETQGKSLEETRLTLKTIFKNANVDEASIVFHPIDTLDDTILYDVDHNGEGAEYTSPIYTTQQFVITVSRDRFEKLPDAIRAVQDLENVDLNFMKRHINDITAIKNTARKQASENVRIQAQELAESMNMRLGDIVSLDGSESYFYDGELEVSLQDPDVIENLHALLDSSDDVTAQVSATFEIHK